jgi:hypothetical protein
VLNKALQVAQNRGMDMGEHFNQVVEMVKLKRMPIIWTFSETIVQIKMATI